MRVFSPVQARSQQERRLSIDAERAKGLLEDTKEILQEKAEAERVFEETLKQQQSLAAKLHEEEVEKKNALKREVELLEERKQKALMPLIEREKAVVLKEEIVSKREEAVKTREADLEEESRLLMVKLDDCSNREQEAKYIEAKVRNMQQGALTQRELLAVDLRRFNEQLASLATQISNFESKKALEEAKLTAREEGLDERERGYAKREEEITASYRKLHSDRELLAKGFAELRKHGYRKTR